jgi:hypothetical protein
VRRRQLSTLLCGLGLGLGLLQAAPVAAQTEQDLRKAFEGRYVIVKMDMPATQKGVDMFVGREPAVDFNTYSTRIREFGIALHDGDRVLVTAVRVKKKNIEFQLGGGGYGVWGDDSGYVYVPTVYKSDREKDLEKRIKDERDPDRRRRMQRELDDLRRDRERENRDNEAQKRDLEEQKKGEIAQKRLGAGSRVNLWFPDDRLSLGAPNPRELQGMLSQVIFFEGDDAPRQTAGPAGPGGPAPGPGGVRPVNLGSAGPPPPADDPGPVGSVSDLKRGMSVEEVHDILGKPTRHKAGKQGDLATLNEWYEDGDRVTEVVYVGGVVVRFSTSSK